MTIDPKEFRNTVGCFATGITVITTVDVDGAPIGLTANSFTSVSLDPPMVLFCLDRNVASFDFFAVDKPFAVNILASDQMDVSNRFAKSGPEKWDGFEYDTWGSGVPILQGCLANLECRGDSIIDGGDHVIVIGEVERMASAGEDVKPILYYRGAYGEVST
ncbi:MAG: flavin reductase [Rhodospirillaceae bacterium]|nr:flavin reductase [Rhodospirillaceae bacterium]|tara:strand:- start:1110 stop:1592 length:483 start_codon:yes stop_codon:yes gene_type:complete